MLGVKLRSLICSPMIKKTLVILVLCCWDFDNLLHRSIAAGICLIHPAELRIMWTFLVSDIMSLAASSAPSVVLLIYLTGCFLRTEGFHRNRGNIWRKIILYLSGLKIYWWVDVSLTNLHKLMWKKKGGDYSLFLFGLGERPAYFPDYGPCCSRIWDTSMLHVPSIRLHRK